MKRLIYAAVLLISISSAAPAAERFAPAKGSMIRIEGTSTLHDWSMEGSTINGEVSVSDDWQSNLAGSIVNVSIPVTSIKSDHARMDRIMSETLKTPEITYQMLTATMQSPSSVKTTGKLTIAGTTREVAMDVNVVKNADGQFTLSGKLPIRMTDYGMKPPVTMMGTLKTGDAVTVTFRWIVAAAK